MDIFEISMLGLGLSMDAFAVSVTNGMCKLGSDKRLTAFQCAMFGVFQGVMPLLGFLSGMVFAGYVQKIDHWISLALLSFIGVKMIVEAISEMKASENSCEVGGISIKMILVQAVATSIDALAVGITFAMRFDEIPPIIGAASLIAAITFVMCFIGVAIGKKFGDVLKEKAQILGGIVLVLIGFKIFIEDILTGI